MLSLDNLLNLVLTVSVALISAYLGFKAAGVNDKNITARKMIEKIYFPIYNLIEKDLFQKITLSKAVSYGLEITNIINQNPMYVYPSLKLYAEQLSNSNQNNYQENFKTLCWSVNRYYDKYSKRIGLPLRSYVYRVNTSQYISKPQLLLYVVLFKLPEILVDLAIILTIYLSFKIK